MSDMNDMSAAIVPKSDQINADDLIAGPLTIRIASVEIRPGTEQPVSIAFDGNAKVFRPCKSMARVMVAAWGPDANAFIGRSMTLYRDPSVTWGGMEVGGIRISHMSHIDAPMVMALTATKGSRKPFQVKPLVQNTEPTAPLLAPDGRLVHVKQRAWIGGVQRAIAAMEDAGALTAWRAAMGEHFAAITESGGGDVVKQAEALIDARVVALAPVDTFQGDLP